MRKPDNFDFCAAREKVLSESADPCGVGTLKEKLLHKILKHTFEPRKDMHEVHYLGSIADIKNEEGITEIQTRAFEKLIPKLRKFLPENRVSVVYPIVYEKRLAWLNHETGELTDKRKSPKKGMAYDALFELSKIEEFLGNENLAVRLVFINCDEYKALDGWDTSKKRGATKIERIPTELVDIIDLHALSDYKILFSEGLPDSFLAKDFEKITRQKGRKAYYSLKLLCKLGIVKRTGKRGRAFVYSAL